MRAFCPRAVLGFVAALVLIPSFSACSSSESPGTGGGSHAGAATASELDSFCNAECARSTRCNPANGTGGQGGASCPQNCKDHLGNLATRIRSEIVRSLTDCYATLACGTNDDSCLASAVVASGEQVDAALHAPDVSTCLRKEMECHDTPEAFSDDICGNLVALVADARAEAARCFSMECGAIPQCLTPIFGH